VHTGALSLAVYTDAAAGDFSGWYRYLPLAPLSRYGLELSFSIPLNCRDVVLWLVVFTGTLQRMFSVRWRNTTAVLSVYDAGAAYQTVATLFQLNPVGNAWYNLKVVADFLTGRYTRLVFNGATYDISTISGWSNPDLTAPTCEIFLAVASDVAASRVFYLDDVIVTMNE
jgi:hypothetical protein